MSKKNTDLTEKEKINQINSLYKNGDITRDEAEQMREDVILKTNNSPKIQIRPITEISERELAEKQFKQIRSINDNVSKIKIWVQIWSWLTIACIMFYLWNYINL